jgi:hypothetical protein
MTRRRKTNTGFRLKSWLKSIKLDLSMKLTLIEFFQLTRMRISLGSQKTYRKITGSMMDLTEPMTYLSLLIKMTTSI